MISAMFLLTANTPTYRQPAPRHGGFTLIELMVGIAIGLMVVAVATTALMSSNRVKSTVVDVGQLQQQASYVFRVLGPQIREAGALKLNLAANKSYEEPIDAQDVVAFSPDGNIYSQNPTTPVAVAAVSGMDSPSPTTQYSVSLAMPSYQEKSFPSGSLTPFAADCLGQQHKAKFINPDDDLIIKSEFVFDSGELFCNGAANTAATPTNFTDNRQPILRNVANFQIQYLIQTDAVGGDPKISYVDAATAAANWNQVFGVEVCLALYGEERMDLPAGTSYLDCDGATLQDITTLADTSRRNRIHKVFRHVYQIRSRGVAG